MSRRDRVVDVAVVLAVGVLGQLEAWLGVGATHRQGPLWAQSALYATTAALLLVRRRHPLGCVVAIAAVSVAEFALVGSPEGLAVALAPHVAIYTAGRRRDWRRSVWVLPVALLLWSAWALLDPLNRTWDERLASMVWFAPSLIAWLLGALLRLGRLTAEQRRDQQREHAARALAEERTRIARELHDVVGHSVSVMTVQASAVRRRLTADQAVERAALETVEATGREALAEMRRLVAALRSDDDRAGLDPAPGLRDLDRLVERFRRAGLPVAVRVTGAPVPLGPGQDLTAYRLVQEGLTNALRHARRPRHAEVVIAYAEGALTVSVRDDGEAVTVGPAGAGLAGMRERVQLYGGTLQTRAAPEGGFELTATLPRELGAA